MLGLSSKFSQRRLFGKVRIEFLKAGASDVLGATPTVARVWTRPPSLVANPPPSRSALVRPWVHAGPFSRPFRFLFAPCLTERLRRRNSHYSPCGNRLGCPDNVIHLFSMSKSFGLAGWRVGYAVYPSWASDEMVKVQDTLPTHACTASQKVALAALEGGGAF